VSPGVGDQDSSDRHRHLSCLGRPETQIPASHPHARYPKECEHSGKNRASAHAGLVRATSSATLPLHGFETPEACGPASIGEDCRSARREPRAAEWPWSGLCGNRMAVSRSCWRR
jgi:hypothetical protein